MSKSVNIDEELSNFIFTSKYARYNEDLKRRETWAESVDRLEKMHLKKYSFLSKGDKDKIKWAFSLVKEKRVVPSMRSLQFGGKAIEAHEPRLYNCSVRHVDSLRSFSELFYLLLCGCVPGETNVVTKDGLRRIDSVKVGDEVYSWNQTENTYELKRVIDVHDVYVKKDDNIKITGRFGNIITSKTHPILVYRDSDWSYVPAGNLKLGDIINKIYLKEDIKFDQNAYFAGSFLGDGCSNIIEKTGSRRIRMTGDNKNVIDKFAEILKNISGEENTVKLSSNKRYSVEVWSLEKTLSSSNKLVENWDNLVGKLPSKKTYSIDIPDWIKKSFSRNSFFSFLAGLIDTDGDVTNSKISINTSSKVLADSLTKYCPIYGLYPYLTEIRTKSYNSSGFTPTCDFYRVTFSITEFKDYYNFFSHSIKQQKIKNYSMDNREQHKTLIIPKDLIENEIKYLGIDDFSIKYNFKYQIEDHGCCRSGYYYSRDKSFDHLLSYDQIVKIEHNLDISENFKDLTVEHNSSYICGDGSYYVSHNCGTGIGLSKFFLNRLPDLVNENDKTGTVITYQILDTIEGWADSVHALLNCYFRNTPYTGRKIIFDYSRIRKKGEPLKTGGGKAPGYKGLKNCHIKIKNLLDHVIEEKKQTRLRSIDAYDIIMHCADAVLSGGVRRSACSVIFDADDQDLINAKTNFKVDKKKNFDEDGEIELGGKKVKLYSGKVLVENKWHEVKINETEYNNLTKTNSISWFHIHPQRARSNNSVLLIRNQFSKEEFQKIFQRTQQYGEPGFVFANEKHTLFNPCQPEFARIQILGKDGYSQFKDLKIGDKIASIENNQLIWTEVISKWSNGIKPVFKFKTESIGNFVGTEDHFVLQYGKKVKAREATHIDVWFNGVSSDFSKVITEKVVSKEYLGDFEVFDITVDNESHTYWTDGCIVSNCFEISFIPVTIDGRTGVQMCNLTSINGKLCDTYEKFKECVEASVIIGTLQAGYTNFPYLNKTSEELTKEEALLGCSITGLMDNPDILLNAKYQEELALLSHSINEEWAKKIKINPSARINCIKPEGTTSLVLGSSSGIHPRHAKRYFRRVQCNKLDNIYKYFKKNNPKLCEHSVWSANNTDDIVIFPLKSPENSVLKSDLTAIEHLEIVKNTQKHWVIAGTTKFNKKNINHNVSCTVTVKEEEWNDVIDYLFNNQEFFTAVSLLHYGSDKDYAQAPHEEVVTEEDLKKWEEMVNSFNFVDYTLLQENDDKTNLSQELTCYGGSCEITNLL